MLCVVIAFDKASPNYRILVHVKQKSLPLSHIWITDTKPSFPPKKSGCRRQYKSI